MKCLGGVKTLDEYTKECRKVQMKRGLVSMRREFKVAGRPEGLEWRRVRVRLYLANVPDFGYSDGTIFRLPFSL